MINFNVQKKRIKFYFSLQEDTSKDLMQSLTKCGDGDGINGVLDFGARRALRAINKAFIKDDIEIIPGLHVVR